MIHSISIPHAGGRGATKPGLKVLAVLAAAVSFFSFAAPTLAAGPTTTSGNQTCASVMGAGFTELKSTPGGGQNGSYWIGDSRIGISYTISGAEGGGSNGVVSFSAASVSSGDYRVMGVFVKGGNIGGNLYDYRPSGTMADSGLHTPANPSGKWAGVSHISFCYALVTQSPTPPPDPSSPPPTPTPTLPQEGKIGLCHATGSASNPFVYIEISANAANYGGHGDHARDILGVDSIEDCPPGTAEPPRVSEPPIGSNPPGRGGELPGRSTPRSFIPNTAADSGTGTPGAVATLAMALILVGSIGALGAAQLTGARRPRP